MLLLARIVSGVVAAIALCAVAALLLFHVEAIQAFGLLAMAGLAGLVAGAAWHHRFRGALTGVVSIAAGVLGAMAAFNLLQLNIKMSPMAIFSGATCGSVVWIISVLTGRFQRVGAFASREVRQLPEGDATGIDARPYLVVSIASLLGGPMLGGVCFAIFSVFVDVHPLDVFDYLSYHTMVGAIAGLLVGVPYFCVWLIEIAKRNRERP